MSYPWLTAAIDAYKPRSGTYGTTFKAFAQQLLETEPACLERTTFKPGHFTGSAWIVNPPRTHVLFIEHPSLKKLMQAGGHADGEQNLFNVAIREEIEEIGYPQDVMHFPLGDAIFHLDVHSIPERTRGGVVEPMHLHFDARFLIEIDHTLPIPGSTENIVARWLNNAEAEQHCPTNLGMWQMLDMSRKY